MKIFLCGQHTTTQLPAFYFALTRGLKFAIIFDY